jgi:hypothetical protein
MVVCGIDSGGEDGRRTELSWRFASEASMVPVLGEIRQCYKLIHIERIRKRETGAFVVDSSCAEDDDERHALECSDFWRGYHVLE